MRYMRLIRKLIYLTVTRLDITFTVSILNRFIHESGEAHWSVALRILAYIKNCLGKGLLARKYEHVHVSGYSDSGYAGDRKDMKSTTRYCTLVG